MVKSAWLAFLIFFYFIILQEFQITYGANTHALGGIDGTRSGTRGRGGGHSGCTGKNDDPCYGKGKDICCEGLTCVNKKCRNANCLGIGKECTSYTKCCSRNCDIKENERSQRIKGKCAEHIKSPTNKPTQKSCYANGADCRYYKDCCSGICIYHADHLGCGGWEPKCAKEGTKIPYSSRELNQEEKWDFNDGCKCNEGRTDCKWFPPLPRYG